MKIIKQGNPCKAEQKLKHTKRFECIVCEYVFEADEDEYTLGGQREYFGASAICPCCKQTAYEIRMRGV